LNPGAAHPNPNPARDRNLMAVDIKAGAQTFDRGTPQGLVESHSLLTGGVNFG
jgi:hypothetical protein